VIHPALISLARRLRPAPADVAAAAAVHDPGLLLALRVAQIQGEPPVPATPGPVR
jgi:hypothetical protein